MKLILRTNIEDSLICRVDNKKYRDIKLRKNYKILLPENAKRIEVVHSDPKRKNAIGFIIMTMICFFLESQKTFEKREFVSFYEFAKDSLVNDFYFETINNDDIQVFLKEKNFGKFTCSFWYSEDVQIHNCFPKRELKHSLVDLISFWFIILAIPIVIILGIVIIIFVKSNSVFELGIFLVVFLSSIFIINTVVFTLQYKNILTNLHEWNRTGDGSLSHKSKLNLGI